MTLHRDFFGADMAKKKMGRPPHVPNDATRRAVEILAASGLYQYQIAAQMKLDEDTLLKYYDYELTCGWATNMKRATDILVKRMEADGDEALEAAKFFLARRGKGLWSDQKNVEVSGPNGGGIPLLTVDLDRLHIDDLEALDEILSPIMIEGEVVDADADAED